MEGNFYLSDKQAAGRYQVKRGTVWRWLNEGNFPAPVKLSPGCTRWRVEDLQRWESEKARSTGPSKGV
jgi:prophage regulatory protein